jgi:ABC-type cobalamin/Fe3+-siderophores transport system ATPase subunit
MTINPILHLSTVQVKRAGHIILNCPDWKVFPGEFVGILGANGAGKTTLLKCLCGLIRPNRGNVQFQDFRVNSWRSRRHRNALHGIGYIPQSAEYNADLPFTVREVVEMGRITSSIGQNNLKDGDIVNDWLNRLGLADRADQTFRSLSGGQQQKTIIARAMAAEPKLLLLDEPGANLDMYWKEQLTETLQNLYCETKITIIMVSHDISLLPPCCMRASLLQQGRILADDMRNSVIHSPALRRAYGFEADAAPLGGEYGVKAPPGKDKR